MANHDRGHEGRKQLNMISLLKRACPNIWIGGRKGDPLTAAAANIEETENWWNILSEEAKTCRICGIKNAPDTINPRVFKESNFAHGSVVFFEKADTLFVLPGLPAGNYNVNRDPLNANIHGANGFIDTVDLAVPGGDEHSFLRQGVTGTPGKKNARAVMFWENLNRVPFYNITIEYAAKIANTMRTLDNVLDDLKNPRVFTGTTPQEIEAIQDYYARRNNNEPWIDVAKAGTFDAKNIGVIEFNTMETGIRDCTGGVEWLLQMYRQLELMDGSQTVDKKAEVTIPELNQGQNVVDIKAKAHRENIEMQFDFINKTFGTNMEPVFYKDEVEEEAKKEAQAKEEKADEQKNPERISK